MSERIAIIGGGIAGLTVAYRLRAVMPEGEITLVEAESRLGGKIFTEHVDGFTIEGGADSILTSKPGGLRLCRALGLLDRLLNTTERPQRAFVKRGGQLFEIPQGLTGLVPTRLAPILQSDLLTTRAKLRMAWDLVRPPGPDVPDESVASFARRRLGNEAYQSLVEPLVGGIYAGDGDALSLAATFPSMRTAERRYGSLIRGMIHMRDCAQPALNGDGHGRSAFVAPRGGMGEIVTALRGELAGINWRVGERATAVVRVGSRYAVRFEGGAELRVDAVIIATPAWATSSLVSELSPRLAQLLSGIEFAPCASVTVGYASDNVPHGLDAYGYVVPRSEGKELVACTWASSKFVERAPEGSVLLRAFLGRAGDVDVVDRSDEALLDLARQEFRDVLGVHAEPEMTRIYRWPQAMPQYAVGHLGRVTEIDALVASVGGLALAGASYRGVGIPDTIASAERAAESVSNHLTRRGVSAS